MTHVVNYLAQVVDIAESLFPIDIEFIVRELSELRDRKGILYIIGIGGSAANATHMSADFRKLCGISAQSLDNIAEITARANDEGWATIFDGQNFKKGDALFVLSVGGGTSTVSTPLVRAIDRAKALGMPILAVVGPHGGYTASQGTHVIKIKADNPTPHTEAFQAVIWHCLVSHPLLQRTPNKWP